jgi:hypothetical protein
LKSGQMDYTAAFDTLGNAFVAGRFSGTTLFGTSSNLVSSGGNDAFLVKFGLRAPTITSLSGDAVVVAGSNTTLQVTTTGAAATYQWQLNGTNLPGAVGSILTLANLDLTKAGRYSVVVQSASGWTTSSVAGVGMIPVLGVYPANNAAVLNWDGTFTLQSAAAVEGPYADVMTGAGPFTNLFAPGESGRYFRLRVPSPALTGTMQPDGFALSFAGSPGRRYLVQSSTNLLDWTPLASDVFPFMLQDTNAAAVPRQFYRALLTP